MFGDYYCSWSCKLFSVPHVKKSFVQFLLKRSLKVYATCYKFSFEGAWCTAMYFLICVCKLFWWITFLLKALVGVIVL